MHPLGAVAQAPDPEPLSKLQATLATLDAAIDRAAGALVADEREMLIDRLRDGRIRPEGLLLKLAESGAAWSLAVAGQAADPATVPAYYHWKNAVASLRQSSRDLHAYVELLVRLADPKALEPAETTALEKKLNSLLQSGLASGGVFDSQAERTAAAGLVSMAGAEAFRLALRRQRGVSFRQAAAANADDFHAHVEALRLTVRKLQANLQVAYNNDANELLEAWDPDKPVAEVRAKRLVALNDATLDRLEALAGIEVSLDSLATFHAWAAGGE